MNRLLVLSLKKLRILTSLSARMVKWTGKSVYPVHPKHLIDQKNRWFMTWIKSGDHVLDLGCDQGQNAIIVSRKARNVLALDYNIKVIPTCKNIRFGYCDLEKKLNLPTGSFDTVLFLDVLEHLNNRITVMREIFRVLKPGGLLLISIPNSETSWKKLQKNAGLNYFTDPDHKIEYTKEEIINVCKKFGFKILDFQVITFDTPLAPLIDLVGGISLKLYAHLLLWKRSQVLKFPEETIGFRIVACKR